MQYQYSSNAFPIENYLHPIGAVYPTLEGERVHQPHHQELYCRYISDALANILQTEMHWYSIANSVQIQIDQQYNTNACPMYFHCISIRKLLVHQ